MHVLFDVVITKNIKRVGEEVAVKLLACFPSLVHVHPFILFLSTKQNVHWKSTYTWSVGGSQNWEVSRGKTGELKSVLGCPSCHRGVGLKSREKVSPERGHFFILCVHGCWPLSKESLRSERLRGLHCYLMTWLLPFSPHHCSSPNAPNSSTHGIHRSAEWVDNG